MLYRKERPGIRTPVRHRPFPNLNGTGLWRLETEMWFREMEREDRRGEEEAR
ncbi:MAG: hypothetical protein IKP40_04255 [Clostridia bacterium]|nr:hypothetical protein [Clostridia bacterium]